MKNKKEYQLYKRKIRGKFIGWEIGYSSWKYNLKGLALFYGREGLKNAKDFLYVIEGTK